MKSSPWRRIAITVSVMLAVLLMTLSYRFVQSRGFFASVEDKSPGACSGPGLAGAGSIADIEVDGAGKTAYIATDDGLFALSLGARQAVRLSGTPKDFHPLAFSLYEDANGVLLRVIFRQGDGIEISLFKVGPGSVTELNRLRTDEVTDPADLAMIDAERFYLINRHGTHTALGRWLDDVLLLPRAKVLFFDGMKFVTVAERLNSPSGIALSPDKAYLYVAEDYPRTIVGFARNDLTGALGDPAALPLPAGPAKMTVGRDGSLIVATQPKSGAVAIYRVTMKDGQPARSERLFERIGEDFPVAGGGGGHLLLSTDERFLDCRI